MICFTSTIVSYTTDLQSRETNFWDTLYISCPVTFSIVVNAFFTEKSGFSFLAFFRMFLQFTYPTNCTKLKLK